MRTSGLTCSRRLTCAPPLTVWQQRLYHHRSSGRDRSSTSYGEVGAFDRVSRARAIPSVSTTSDGSVADASGIDQRHRSGRRYRPTSVSRSRVVPGMSVTIARPTPGKCVEERRLSCVRATDNDDLRAFAYHSARLRVAEQRIDAGDDGLRSQTPPARARRSDIPRRQNRVTPRAASIISNSAASMDLIAFSERAFELIECRSRLQGSHRGDEILGRLRPARDPFDRGRYARSVNSPGSASRAPASIAERTIAC